MKKYLKFIWSHAWAAKGTYQFVFLFLVLESISSYILIYLQKILIDDVFANQHYSWLVYVIVIFIAAAVVYSLMSVTTNYFLVNNEFRISRSLLGSMLERIEKAPIGRFQNERHGTYVYILTQDVYFTASFLGYQIPRFGFQELFNLAILMAVIGYSSTFLLLLVLIMSILYMVTGYYFAPRLRVATNNVEENRAALLVQIEEGIASTREIAAFHRMKWEEKKYNTYFGRFFDKVMVEAKLVNKQMRYSDPLKWGIGIVVLGYGGLQLMKGHMTIGTFVIVFQFATQLSDSFYNLFQFVMSASSQFAYIDRVNQVLEMEQHESGNTVLGEQVNQFTLDNVTFRYTPELPYVLRGFSGELPIGKKIAIVGKSGSGKSTIAELLLRFYEPTEGGIHINGLPIQNVSRKQWAEKVAIVFQEPYLFPDTIRENLLLGRYDLTDRDIEEACIIAQIHHFILSLPEGYETNIGERGIKLSGGQRQRLAIARAIIGNPEILILDEATSALDMDTERLVLAALDEKRSERTTITIAHRLSTVENADMIYVMDRGALIETGTHLELHRPVRNIQVRQI